MVTQHDRTHLKKTIDEVIEELLKICPGEDIVENTVEAFNASGLIAEEYRERLKSTTFENSYIMRNISERLRTE